MHLSYWMIMLAALLPYLTVGLAKSQTTYDNTNPRRYLANLQGWRARANAAHQNHFEAFPAFAAAVLVAQMKATPQHTIDLLACAFIAIRLAYTATYLADLAPIRSLVWFAGIACTIALFAV